MLFGPDFTMNCTQLINGGRGYPCGYIHHDGANHAVTEFTVDYGWAGLHAPGTSRITVTDVSGLRLEIDGIATAQSCLYRKGLVIQESAARFETTIDGQRRGGIGLTEHAWHGGIPGLLRVLPRLRPAARMVLR